MPSMIMDPSIEIEENDTSSEGGSDDGNGLKRRRTYEEVMESLPPKIEALVFAYAYESEQELNDALALVGIDRCRLTANSLEKSFEEIGFPNLSFKTVDGNKPRLDWDSFVEKLYAAGYDENESIEFFRGKPYIVHESTEHNDLTNHLVRRFNVFQTQNPLFGLCVKGVRIPYGRSNRIRKPSLGCWGLSRCTVFPENGYPDKGIGLPDIIIEISCSTELDDMYEKIEDCMNRAVGEESEVCPRLGYLIKLNHSNPTGTSKSQKDVTGLDIYRFEHGGTRETAQHWEYQPGGRDVPITITRRDLGFPSHEEFQDNEFEWVTASKLYQLFAN